jgi:hypothetical protein
MELQFRYALAAIGAILIAIGLSSVFLNMKGPGGETDYLDAVSTGFSSAFQSIFAGVIMGVGAALITDAMLQALRERQHRILSGALLSIAAVLLAAYSVLDAGQVTFFSMLVFFTSLTFSTGMVISCTAICLTALASRLMGGSQKKRQRKLPY